MQPAEAKLFGGRAGELSKAMRDEMELWGRKFELVKPLGHYATYSTQYGGGVYHEATKVGKPRGGAGRGQGSFSKKKDSCAMEATGTCS